MTKLYCPNGHKITKHYFQPIEIISPARPFARWHVSYCELCIRPYFDRECLTEEQLKESQNPKSETQSDLSITDETQSKTVRENRTDECEHATYTELKEEDGFVKGKCLCGRWKSIAPSSLIDIGKSQSQIAIEKVIEAFQAMLSKALSLQESKLGTFGFVDAKTIINEGIKKLEELNHGYF